MELLYESPQVAERIDDIAGKILAEFSGDNLEHLALLGIQSNGLPLAQRLAGILGRKTGLEPNCGAIDITMHRDDFGIRRELRALRETIIDFDINERYIVLVDDVLDTGRSIRAALDLVTDYGRPSLIRLAVLVNRGRREYPICADYAGFEYRGDSKVKVVWDPDGKEDLVYLKEPM